MIPRFIPYNQGMTPDSPDQPERLEKLELSAGYAERHIEVLSDEIAQINAALSGLVRRIDRIESRMIEINDKVGEAPPMVPPPHSAGPDVPREPL